MIYDAKEFTLKNGIKVILRSPEVSDAQKLINQIVSVAGSTEFLLSTPEDFDVYKTDIKREEELIEWSKTDNGHWIIVLHNDEIIGNCSLRFFKHVKDHHRGTIGIAINEGYRGIGLGSILFDEMIKLAKSNPEVDQIELDVIATNEAGLRLYKSKGFIETGRIPRQLKRKDGTYLDGITMVLYLR